MRTQLALSHVDATPGLTSRIEIEVTNTSTVIEGVTAIVDGINPEWVRLERPVVSLLGLLRWPIWGRGSPSLWRGFGQFGRASSLKAAARRRF